MAAQPEESDPELEHKDRTAAEMESNQGGDELPCPSNDTSWKECFHEKVQQRCLSLQETKVRLVQAQKAEEAKVRRREPGDWLAREWYNEEKETLDTRIYLLDSLLPTLIPGVENLLMEVERNHVLVSDQKATRFNPVNHLGEYLMRHNPQYNVPTKPGPYLREMKVVSDDLKSLRQGPAQRLGLINLKYAYDGVFLIPVPMSRRLIQMRAEAKSKREEREEVERQKAEETARRKEVLAALFKEWTVDGDYRIPAALLVLLYTEHVSSDKFQEIMEYLQKCAEDFQEATKHDTQRQIFTNLFQVCDYRKVGVLDRQKILALLRDFYDGSVMIDEWEFWNPRKWPIIELQDINLMDFWGSLGDKEVCEEFSENVILSQTEISEGEILGHEPVDDDKQETDRMSTSVTEGIVEATDLDGDTLYSEKSTHEDTKTEREAEPETVVRQDEALPGSASAENSLNIDGEPGPGKSEESTLGREPEIETKPERDHTSATEPGSGKSEESILGREPEIETKPEGDHTSATEPGSGKSEESILGREPEIETKPEGDHTSSTEPGSEGQVSQEDSGVTESAPEATSTASGDGAVTDTGVTDSQQDTPAAEAVQEAPASNQSQSDQETSSEIRLKGEDLLPDQGKDSGPSVAKIQNHQDSCTKSSFAASCLTLPQFVQLMDNFVGEDISLPIVKRLTAFIKQEYKQTEEERKKLLEKVHLMSRMTQRRVLLETLFEKWDSNACGSLDLEEVVAVLRTFKGGMGKDALMKAREQLCSRYPQLSRVGKLSPKALQTFLELIAATSPGKEDETFDNLVRFLTTSVEQSVEQNVEQSHTKSLQSSARKKWLHDIQQAAESSVTSLEPVYKAVIKALSQDMEAHGNNKRISAYIAFLEENQLPTEQGEVLLRYVACTADDAPHVLNQELHRDMKGISFAAIDQGKPIHVPRVQLHGNIHFWNSDRPVEESMGSFLVLPLYDAHWRAFGILGLDTLRDQSEKSFFQMHEITFYQGVCHAFSKAYDFICVRENVLQVAVTALDWLYPRTPSIHAVTTYLVAPGKDEDYALCKVITTDNTGQKEIHSPSVVLLREENLLRDYLFKCRESSEVTLTSVYGEHHIAVPLHDLSRQTLAIFDISIGQHKKLPPEEQKDLQRMLKMAQAACLEILQRSLEETEPTQVLGIVHTDKLDDNLIREIYCFDPTASSVQVQAELLLDLISDVPQAAVWQQDSAPAEYLYQWLRTCLALAEITKRQHTEIKHP
ncbi:EF-hand calcium-binding domain-containing protein 5 isoform X2 [Turdus rufiventris]|nr:EF-hand calcium-binding domain-containing protein 5 isoform X2 [Turdus rufiventris]